VINKPIDIKLKNLFEKVELPLDRAELAEQPVFFGGPVQTERGFVLHEKQLGTDSPYTSTMSVPGGLEMTTSKDVLEAMSNGAGPQPGAGHAGLQRLVGRASWKTRSAAMAG
jgi:putative transcriptional regulator